jgi:hypothetical protein
MLYRDRSQEVENSITYEELKNIVLVILEEDYPDWHIIRYARTGSLPQVDFVIIKTVKKQVVKHLRPNSPNPLQTEKEEFLQIVVAINIDNGAYRFKDMPSDRRLDNADIIKETSEWTHKHLFIDSPERLIRAMKKFDEDHE